MPNTDYFVHKIFDHMFRNQSYTPASTVYVGLLTTAPTGSDGSGAVECSASWYSRQAVTLSAASARGTSNSAQITFTSSASQAVTDDIEGVAIYDAASSGNMLRYLKATANLVVAVGSQVIIPAGQLSMSETWNP